MKNDLGKIFNELVDGMFLRYRGVLGERTPKGILYGTRYYTEQGFKDEVTRRIKEIGITINRIK